MKHLAEFLGLHIHIMYVVALFVLPLVVFALYSLYLRLVRGTKLEFFQKEGMPKELRNASLIYNERPIATDYPVSVRGVIDQGFRTKGGALVLVDTKTRSSHRTYPKDRFQLSLYAFILANNGLLDLARYGYIRTVVSSCSGKRSVRYHKISLMNHAEVLKHIQR